MEYENYELTSLCEEYLRHPRTWKSLVLNCPLKPLSLNALQGFSHLSIAMHATICTACHDEVLFRWLHEFARAWVDQTDLPVYKHQCVPRGISSNTGKYPRMPVNILEYR